MIQSMNAISNLEKYLNTNDYYEILSLAVNIVSKTKHVFIVHNIYYLTVKGVILIH